MASTASKGQLYKEQYSQQWSWVTKSKSGPEYVHCSTCVCDFSIKHGGANDINKHLKTTKHENKVKALQGLSTIKSFVNNIPSPSDSAVTSAECKVTNFIIEHNLPVNVSDHFTELIKSICPDSQIAKNYQCKRTKTTHIVHAMSREVIESVASTIKIEPFSIATDGSECRHKQLYPILVRYPDAELEKVVTRLLKLCDCRTTCTGENIFKMLDLCVCKYSNWKQCVALSVDNESTMTGLNKGLAGHVLRNQSKIFISGCTCHLIHLAAGKAAATLPIKIEDLLIDIFFYLEKSHKRSLILEELQKECGADVQTILKHCSVRWLSLEKCIIRLIMQWEPLTMFFTQEVQNHKPKVYARKPHSDSKRTEPPKKSVPVHPSKKRSTDCNNNSESGTKSKMVKTSKSISSKTKEDIPRSGPSPSSSVSSSTSMTLSQNLKLANINRLDRVFYLLTDSRTKLYALFLNSTTPIFNTLNMLLQRNDPCIHKLHNCILNLLTDIYIRFVLPDAVKVDSLQEVKYRDRNNQKERENIVIGSKTRSYLNECKANASISREDRTEFFETVREYFCTAADYIIKKFPINKLFVLHAEVADINLKSKVSFDSIKFFVNHLPCLSDLCDTDKIDDLEIEFLRYQVKEIPPELYLATISIDTVWFKLKKDFPNLARVMLAILVIPHSNSEAERVFSIVRKNDTPFRSSLGVDLLESLLITKIDNLAKGTPCYKKNFTHSFLSKAKSSTYNAKKNAQKNNNEKQNSNTDYDNDITGDILNMVNNSSKID